MNHDFILTLFDVGAIQFGKFKKQSGTLAPFDLDLRVLVSHPDALREAARTLVQTLNTLTFDRIAAIPYAALPIGTAVAMEIRARRKATMARNALSKASSAPAKRWW
jgi:uridine monophosphate synthetase